MMKQEVCSDFSKKAIGIEPVAFFDGVRKLVILSLTRSDPYSDPLGVGSDVTRMGVEQELEAGETVEK